MNAYFMQILCVSFVFISLWGLFSIVKLAKPAVYSSKVEKPNEANIWKPASSRFPLILIMSGILIVSVLLVLPLMIEYKKTLPQFGIGLKFGLVFFLLVLFIAFFRALIKQELNWDFREER